MQTRPYTSQLKSRTIMKNLSTLCTIIVMVILILPQVSAQEEQDPALLTIDRIYASSEFNQERMRPIQWTDNGQSYVIVERKDGAHELIKYQTATQERQVYLSAEQLTPSGHDKGLRVSSFTLSADASKALIFTNTSRVWRTNTKGDYWVYDFDTAELSQLGASFPSSSLMFAKFSADNKYVAYVQDFNLYIEEFTTGEITQLTQDGTRDISNGTFDWVYEEEFGCRDGFRWSPDGQHIAYWQLDASDIRTFYMINNTDSIYSQLIPLQYPKVGENPSSCIVNYIDIGSGQIKNISVPGDPYQHYIPAMQWIAADQLLIQQLNRKQNHLQVWLYDLSSDKLRIVYEEHEDTWVDLSYPDATASNWGDNDLVIIDEGSAFLRMTENDTYRHVYKVSLEDGAKKLLTPGSYDVASWSVATDELLYFMASPENATQRYLYSVDLLGQGDTTLLTPTSYSGVNRYNISPDGQYAWHSHSDALTPNTVRLVSLPNHQVISNQVNNTAFIDRLGTLNMPSVEYHQVTTEDGVTMDARMIKPYGFNAAQQYPVIFHVYGEPWGAVANDQFIGLWHILLSQQGYVVMSIDNRGTPTLKGSAWRKSIYRSIGTINAQDQGKAAQEILKLPYLDASRVGVYGWSGGGSMTLNMLFQFPEVYHVGISGAPVSYQLYYDNIYQERYMGLPQENVEDFIEGSPVTHAHNLKGKLLLIHGTGDDNVHYQSSERLINELIKHNKQFDFMPYPNRSHGAYEGANTVRHKQQLMFHYFKEHLLPKSE